MANFLHVFFFYLLDYLHMFLPRDHPVTSLFKNVPWNISQFLNVNQYIVRFEIKFHKHNFSYFFKGEIV